MEINKIDALKFTDFKEGEKVFVTIVSSGDRIIVEPLSSLQKGFIDDEGLNNLGVAEMTRSFGEDEETPEDFMMIVRVK